eukprot:CAMPEP_0172203002 /NCGR_PEP_ID=MMETSP1050-20130122/31008_1 /TAXON_ID=233186 /ORGANISM="Cryptomonas curvata, Strain CCAP979/52" /LENGTH=111 /DNA_ID=CAMNT_0012881101 /DNA_START=49 /DNA_END=384 /DNA_ORIENTATION=-
MNPTKFAVSKIGHDASYPPSRNPALDINSGTEYPPRIPHDKANRVTIPGPSSSKIRTVAEVLSSNGRGVYGIVKSSESIAPSDQGITVPIVSRAKGWFKRTARSSYGLSLN